MASLSVQHGELQIFEIVVGVGIDPDVHVHAGGQRLRIGLSRSSGTSAGRTVRIHRPRGVENGRIDREIETCHMGAEEGALVETVFAAPGGRRHSPKPFHRLRFSGRLGQVDMDTVPELLRTLGKSSHRRRSLGIGGMGRHLRQNPARFGAVDRSRKCEVGLDLRQGAGFRIQ